MNRGYVKVWRKIEDSGLIQLPNTLALFMHLLLNATHKDRKVGTTTGVIELKRGQFISGLHKLSSKLEQSDRQIRTSIDRLVKLGIISVKATNKYSIYTIENYSIYQDSDTQNDNQTTNNRQTNDKETTTKQELNNLNIKEKNATQKNEFFAEVDKEVLTQWLAVRKKKRSVAVSKIVYDAVCREAEKAGITVQEAITHCVEKSWTTFDAGWYESSSNKSASKFKNKSDVISDSQFDDWLNSGEKKVVAING